MTGDECNVSLMAAKPTLLSQSKVTRDSRQRKEIIALDPGTRSLKECLDSTTLEIKTLNYGDTMMLTEDS